MSSTEEPTVPLPLPSAPVIEVSPAVSIQPPLSRLGKGPALILLVDQEYHAQISSESLDPPPIQKWAEESYNVGQIDVSKVSRNFGVTLSETIALIKELPSYDGNEKIGVIGEQTS